MKGECGILCCFLAWSVALYLPVFPGAFHFDDKHVILENEQITDISHVWTYLSHPYPRGVLGASFVLDYALWGGRRPAGFHLTNVLLHGLCAWLLWRILVRRFGEGVGAWVGALLFLAHPIQTQAVAYVSGRSAVLATFFVLLGYLVYDRVRGGGYRDVLRWAGVSCCALLACCSKEIGWVLPAWIMLDLFVRGKECPRPWGTVPGLRVLGLGFPSRFLRCFAPPSPHARRLARGTTPLLESSWKSGPARQSRLRTGTLRSIILMKP
jgi:hypothetical protein